LWDSDADDRCGERSNLVVVRILYDESVDLCTDTDVTRCCGCIVCSLEFVCISSSSTDYTLHLCSYLSHFVRIFTQSFQLQLQSIGTLLTGKDDVGHVVLVFPALPKGLLAAIEGFLHGIVVLTMVALRDNCHGCCHIGTGRPAVAGSRPFQRYAGVCVGLKDFNCCLALGDLCCIWSRQVALVTHSMDVFITFLQSH